MADGEFWAASAGLGLAAGVANSIMKMAQGERPKTFTPLKQPVPPRHFAYGRGRKPGVFTFFQSVNGYTLDVIAFCHGRIRGDWEFYLNEDKIVLNPNGTTQGFDGHYGNPVVIKFREGLPTETAYDHIVEKAAGTWTASHRGDFTASAGMRCQMVAEDKMQRIYPNGQIQLSATADWLCVYDWRDPTQDRTDPTTWKWSENPIVCQVHDEWATNYPFWSHVDPVRAARERDIANRIWTRRFSSVLDVLTSEADACDELVVSEGGTVPRYSAFVWYSADTDRKTVRDMFRRSCDGWSSERGDGSMILRCGRWLVSPTPISDDMIVDISGLSVGVPKSRLVNELQVRFASPDHRYELIDTQPFTDESSITRRGRKADTLELPEVTNNSQARRIGKANFYARNAPYEGQLILDLDQIPLTLFDYRFHPLAISEGPSAFNAMHIEILSSEVDWMDRTVTLSVRSASADAYDWDAGSEEGPPPPPPPAPPTPEAIPVPEIIGSPEFINKAIRFTLDGPLPYESLTPVIRWWPTANPSAVTMLDVFLSEGPDDDFYVFSGSITGFPATVDGLTASVAYRDGSGTLGEFTADYLITII